MSEYDYDLFVIGAGSGGVRASRMAAGYGARVAIAEESRVGGTCVIRGCIPKKLLVYAGHFAEDFADAAGYGWTVEGARFSWPDLIAAKDREIDRLNGLYLSMLKSAGVTLYPSRARIEGPHRVRVGDKSFTARYILIATGAWPSRPDIPGIEHTITSNEAFHLKDLPRRIAIVGGGYIAVEFASIFNALGAETALLYRGEQILRGFDDDLRRHLHDEMVKKGVKIRLHAEVRAIEKRPSGALCLDLGGVERLECDAILYATGRRPHTQDLGLEAVGVELDGKGAVKVDDFSQTSVPGLYAIGDVTDRLALTPVAIKEGAAAAATLFGGRPTKPSHENVPSAVFSQPAVGTVGLSEAKAIERFGEVDIYKSTFRPLLHTLSGRDERTLMKLVVERAGQKVVGAHMVGADAAEIIQGLAIAIRLGATKAEFDATVGIHPSAAEEFVTMREKWQPPKQAAAE